MPRGNLLILIDSFVLGGTETQIYTTVPHLLRAGMNIVVVGADGPLSAAFAALGCKVHHIHFPLGDSVPPLVWQEIEETLDDILEREAITVVHGHQLPSTRFVVRIAKRRGIPICFTVHGTYYDTAMLKAVLDDTAHIVSVSPPIHDWLQGNGIESIMIPNGIATDYFQPMDGSALRPNYNLDAASPVVVYAARMAWEKAEICMQLINACRSVRREAIPNLQVLIAGGGPDLFRVVEHAHSIHTNEGAFYIHCLGEQLDLRPMFAIADCVVGTGRVAMEAMACGRPVIAAGTRGMVGIVTPARYEQAIRCHFGDHDADRPITMDALTASITAVLSAPEWARALGRDGRERIVRDFDIHAIAHR